MASKKVMVITEDDIKTKLVLGAAEIETLKFLQAHAGIEMDEGAQQDFIAARNAKAVSISRLWEFKEWCKKTVEFIETMGKYAFDVGSVEEFPANVSLKNNGSTYEFVGDAAAIVADTLLKKKLVSKEQFFSTLTVSNIEKATGIKKEKLIEMFPDVILEKKKSATLVIK